MPPPTLAIAVLTFRRPDDLAEIVPLLLAQAEAAADLATVHVLVVDNDPAGSAREFIEQFGGTAEGATSTGAPGAESAAGHPVAPLIYVHEPQPGITAARNRALAEAGSSDVLVFIDDDERPSAGWLRALLSVHLDTGCAAVAGPVVSVFEREPEAFIAAGRYFERQSHRTADPIQVAATNNLLLDLRQIRRFGLSFDVGLGISGGGDTLFTRQIVANGGAMLWAAEAIVTDVVPRARITRRWVILRVFRSGNSWSVTSLMLAHSTPQRLATRLELSARGGARALVGTAQIVFGLFGGGLARRARGTRTLARGAGMLAGAWGYGYREYRRA